MTAVTESYDTMYASIENMIRQMAWKFTKRYGGEFEEWLSDANASCATALTRFCPDRAVRLTTWVYRCVYFDLITAVEKRTRYYRKHEQLDETLDIGTDNTVSALTDLSDDARTIVSLFVAAPSEVLELVGGTATAAALRHGVRKYLLRQGWTVSKYTKTLDEIKEVLTV